jgi:CBS domain-containing protein
MVTGPTVHRPSTTVGQLRKYFNDDHVHMALLVEGGRLVGAVAREDLAADAEEGAPALELGTLAWRTVATGLPLAKAEEAMRRSGCRRLAVVREDGALLGLLCLKASGRGFCSDADIANRHCPNSAAQVTT